MDNAKRIASEKRILRRYLTAARKARFRAHRVSYGDGEGENVATVAEIISAVYAVDECWVYFKGPAGKGVLFIVLGNEPEEVVNDAGGCDAFLKAIDAEMEAIA